MLGANGLTEIKNANQARINGLEMDVSWAITSALTMSGGVAFLDSELTENYGFTDANNRPVTDCPIGSVEAPEGPLAPEGAQLPITPKFKGNLTARHEFPTRQLRCAEISRFAQCAEAVCRMPMCVCQPPATLIISPRFASRRCVSVSSTSDP